MADQTHVCTTSCWTWGSDCPHVIWEDGDSPEQGPVVDVDEELAPG